MLMVTTSVFIAAIAVGQPDVDERRAALEQRRDLLKMRLSEIEAELSGEASPGSVRLFGPQGGSRGDQLSMSGREFSREPRPVFDAETRDRLLKELGENDPELAERIRESMRAHRVSSLPVFGRLRELNELRERDPEAFAIRRDEIRAGLEVLRLSGTLRDLISSDADRSEVDSVMQQLRDAVADGFDAKGAVLRSEISRTEQRASDMQAKLEHAEANRTQLVEQHFEKLVERIRRAAVRRNKSDD